MKNNKNYYLGYGISFGLLGGSLLGVILNIIFETPLVWAFTPGIGLIIGMTAGIMMDAKNKDN